MPKPKTKRAKREDILFGCEAFAPRMFTHLGDPEELTPEESAFMEYHAVHCAACRTKMDVCRSFIDEIRIENEENPRWFETLPIEHVM